MNLISKSIDYVSSGYMKFDGKNMNYACLVKFDGKNTNYACLVKFYVESTNYVCPVKFNEKRRTMHD